MSTKILSYPFCDSKFLICYLRINNLQKSDLNLLPAKRESFKIGDAKIRSDIGRSYEVFKAQNVDHSTYFNVNLIVAQSRSSSSHFNLRKTLFIEGRQVETLFIDGRPVIIHIDPDLTYSLDGVIIM